MLDSPCCIYFIIYIRKRLKNQQTSRLSCYRLEPFSTIKKLLISKSDQTSVHKLYTARIKASTMPSSNSIRRVRFRSWRQPKKLQFITKFEPAKTLRVKQKMLSMYRIYHVFKFSLLFNYMTFF